MASSDMRQEGVLASSHLAIQEGNMSLEHKLRKLDHLNNFIRRSLEMVASDIAPEAQTLAQRCLADLTRSRAVLISQIEGASHYPSMDLLEATTEYKTVRMQETDSRRSASS
jgi:hypothetical protein